MLFNEKAGAVLVSPGGKKPASSSGSSAAWPAPLKRGSAQIPINKNIANFRFIHSAQSYGSFRAGFEIIHAIEDTPPAAFFAGHLSRCSILRAGSIELNRHRRGTGKRKGFLYSEKGSTTPV